MSESRQLFVPMIAYEDAIAAMEWLAQLFNLTESARFLSSDGRLEHGQLERDGQVLILASPSPDYQSPIRMRSNYAAVKDLSTSPYIMDGVLIYVDDVDQIFEKAQSMNGKVLSEIEEGFPGRRFRLEDPEGHRWYVIEKSP